jgi:release factor glutamine methyltransferase
LSETIRETLNEGDRRLAKTVTASRLEAEYLLMHVIDKSRSYLRAWSEHPVKASDRTRYLNLIDQRAAGIPLAYLLGYREFWSRSFKVDENVLIPRAETEVLIEQALERITDETRGVLELGIGSGALVISLALERPKVLFTGTDLSWGALKVSEENLRHHGVSNVSLKQGHWFEAVEAQALFDLIISNPPYIREDDPHVGMGDLRFEPKGALVSGPSGLEDIESIVRTAPGHLHSGGTLLLEHGYDQSEAVTELMRQYGFLQIKSHPDLLGHNRVASGRRA